MWNEGTALWARVVSHAVAFSWGVFFVFGNTSYLCKEGWCRLLSVYDVE